MSNRVIALLGSKKIPLEIASEIVVRGEVVAKRLVNVIDPNVIKATAYKVEAAYDGNVMFTDENKAKVNKLVITSMPHDDSPMDPDCHISLTATLAGAHNMKAHVTIDPAKQQPARSDPNA